MRLTVIEGEEKKIPLLVEVGAKEIAVGRVPFRKKAQAEELARFRGRNALQSFLQWVGRRKSSAQSEYFVLLVRADGVPKWGALIGTLQATGFDVGWDVWPDDKSLFTRP